MSRWIEVSYHKHVLVDDETYDELKTGDQAEETWLEGFLMEYPPSAEFEIDLDSKGLS